MKLRPYQRAAIDAVRDLWDGGDPNALVVLATGLGKALRADQRVLTPTGWRPIGDLAVGDEVIGADGHPTRVVGVFPQGLNAVHAVEITGGAVVYCDNSHLWTAFDDANGGKRHTLSLCEMREAGLLRWSGTKYVPRWRLPSVHAWCPEAPVEPYIAGSQRAGLAQTVCIKVAAPDGLFVTEGYTVTHNTIVFTTIGKELRAEGYRKVLVLAHRDELIEQARDKWLKVDPTESVGIYKGPTRELWADVIVASIQSCYGDVYRNVACDCTNRPMQYDAVGWPTKPEKKPADPGCGTCGGAGEIRTFIRPGRVHELPLDQIDLLVVDECHHITKDSQYVQVLNAIREKNPDCRLLAVTATPYRTDGRGLGFLFNGVAYSMGIKRGIDEGYLSPVRCERVVLQIDLSQVRTSKTTGDFVEKDLGSVMDTPEARDKIVEAWAKNAGPGTYPGDPRGRLTAVFSPTVESARHLAEAFQAAGHPADWICGDKKLCPVERRKAVLASYERGETRVLVNVAVLTEGWDVPATSCIVVARPTKSKVLLVQMVGRGTRLQGLTLEESIRNGKPDCLVIDVTGASQVGLVSMADLSDDEPKLTKKKRGGDEDEEEEAEQDEEQLEFPDEITTRRVVGYSSFEVDLFGGGVDWCRINGARVAGMTAGRTMVVFRTAAGFTAICTGRKVTVVAEDQPEREAMKAAELYALENGEKTYLQPGKWFAQKAASDKQRAMVERLLALPCNENRIDAPNLKQLSMQQASAWIGYLTARRVYANELAKRAGGDAAAAPETSAAVDAYDPFADEDVA